GLDKAPGPATWKKAIEYVSSQASDTTAKIRAVEARKFEHAEKVREIDAKIASIRRASKRKVRRVRIAVDCAAPGRKEFDLSYLVTGGVKWGPRYDVRLDRVAGEVELSSLASVTQETGEDWSDALLTFSTRLPAKGLRPPEVSPVFLDAIERVDRRASASMVEVEEDESLAEEPSAPASAPAKSLEYVGAAAGPPGVGSAPKAARKTADTIAEIRSGGEAVEFVAAERVTVRTDGQPVTVAIGRWGADCSWGYEAVPKILASVYIRAVFPNPTNALMLPGPGDCYLDGAYVGRMEVPSTPAGARVNMSFGAAESLSVSRTAEPLTSERRGVRGRRGRVYRYDYTIELANSGEAAAAVTVLDNVPVSTIEAIRVGIEPGTTPHEELDGGRLRWLVELGGGEHKEIRLRYRVEISKHYRY
ncbi:MAG: mucoidy inhibitor MuiA family protein, partial [Planctomycetota bacterium]